MIEKFAGVRGLLRSEFHDLNHTSKSMILVSLMIAKFARDLAARHGELRNRDTGVNPASHARTSERAEDDRPNSLEFPHTHVHPAIR